MRVPFIKMHGLGNDFVVLDGRETPISMAPPLAAALADRKTGIGCDQVIVLVRSSSADLGMRIFNADGGEVESCGNASRAVEMGRPRFEWQDIPLAYAMDTLALPVGWEDLENPGAVNVGNPHVVFFVPDCDAVDLARLGPQIECDPLFPERINVNVATLVGPDHLRLRVWERGTGLTRACGTGACASAVAAIRRGMTAREVRVTLPGGTLDIAWPMGGQVRMSGPASESYRGSFELADFGVAA